MRKNVLRPRSWLVLLWRVAARLAMSMPRHHPARSYVQAVSKAMEAYYWRQARARWRARARGSRHRG